MSPFVWRGDIIKYKMNNFDQQFIQQDYSSNKYRTVKDEIIIAYM